MTLDEIKNIIEECCNDIYFEYNNQKSGVTSEVTNFIPTFTLWYGKNIKKYENIDDLFIDKVFEGNSLIDLIKNGIDIKIA